MKIYQHDAGHMTKINVMLIYDKNTSKTSASEPVKVIEKQ